MNSGSSISATNSGIRDGTEIVSGLVSSSPSSHETPQLPDLNVSQESSPPEAALQCRKCGDYRSPSEAARCTTPECPLVNR
jgi:hypothetical protein